MGEFKSLNQPLQFQPAPARPARSCQTAGASGCQRLPWAQGRDWARSCLSPQQRSAMARAIRCPAMETRPPAGLGVRRDVPPPRPARDIGVGRRSQILEVGLVEGAARSEADGATEAAALEGPGVHRPVRRGRLWWRSLRFRCRQHSPRRDLGHHRIDDPRGHHQHAGTRGDSRERRVHHLPLGLAAGIDPGGMGDLIRSEDQQEIRGGRSIAHEWMTVPAQPSSRP